MGQAKRPDARNQLAQMQERMRQNAKYAGPDPTVTERSAAALVEKHSVQDSETPLHSLYRRVLPQRRSLGRIQMDTPGR